MPGLFDQPKESARVTKYQAKSATSRAAAADIERSADTLRGKVYRCIADAGPYGLTDEQVQGRLSMNPSTERPRRVELVERGLITQAGTRKTKSGRKAAVWVAEKQD